MKAIDELDLTHLNDGTLTRVLCPPSRGSTVDLYQLEWFVDSR
jgi:hypothetical protein